MKKNNTWNIRRLVDDSFVPLSKQPSVLYCKLTDFMYSEIEKKRYRETGPQLVLKCFLLKMLRILKGQKWVARMSDALVSKRSELIKAFHLGLLKIEK